MRMRYMSNICVILVAVIIFDTHAFAQSKVFSAEGMYSMTDAESTSIAREKGYLDAKRKVMAKALPFIEELLKTRGKLTKDQLLVLAFFSSGFKEVETKEIAVDDVKKYTTTLQMELSSEAIAESAQQATGKFIAEDYKKVLEQIDQNQKQLDGLVKQMKKTKSISKKATIKNKIEESEKTFQGLVSFERGFGYFLNSESDLAIKEFTRAIEIDPTYIKAYSYRARSYDLTGNKDAAIQDYNKIIYIDPTYEIAYYNLGNTYLMKDEYDLAMQNLNKVIVLNPKFGDAYNDRGIVYFHREQYALAIDDFTKSISLNPDDPTIYHNRGFAFYKKRDYDAAIHDSTRAIEMKPDYAEAHFIRGLSYIELLDTDKGMPDIEKACKINFRAACDFIKSYPHDKIEYKKAWTYYNSGEIDNASDMLKKINKPNDERTIILRSLIYLKQNKPEDALNLINKVRIKIEKAYARLESNDPKDQALSDEEEKDIKDYYHYMLFIIGSAQFHLNNCKKAIEELEKFVLKYENVTVSDMLGICYATGKEYGKAEKYFFQGFKILENQPSRNIDAYNTEAYNLASVNALLGKTEEAVRWAKIPLEYNRKQWLDKIKNDKDFDSIRNDEKFKDFILEQEVLLAH